MRLKKYFSVVRKRYRSPRKWSLTFRALAKVRTYCISLLITQWRCSRYYWSQQEEPPTLFGTLYRDYETMRNSDNAGMDRNYSPVFAVWILPASPHPPRFTTIRMRPTYIGRRKCYVTLSYDLCLGEKSKIEIYLSTTSTIIPCKLPLCGHLTEETVNSYCRIMMLDWKKWYTHQVDRAIQRY